MRLNRTNVALNEKLSIKDSSGSRERTGILRIIINKIPKKLSAKTILEIIINI